MKWHLVIPVLLLMILPTAPKGESPSGKALKERIISSYTGRIPREWGERVTGVKTKLQTAQRVFALTFDACGGPKGSGYDGKLINFLLQEKIPATLFISGQWIDANLATFLELARNPLFEIGNHGLNHKPCSVNGRSAHGIHGTESVAEVVEEIEGNALKIEALTGRKPRHYRAGTAYCDEVAVAIANALGYEVANFNILGDAGAMYSREKLKEALLHAPPSSIVLMHMNYPPGETAEALMEALPELRRRGIQFVKLSECPLQ